MSVSVAQIRPGDHVCALIPDEDAHLAIAADYIRGAFGRNERVLYIVDHSTAAGMLQALRDRGLPVDEATRTGQLVILHSRDAYLKGDRFDPDAMIATLKEAEQAALRDGWTGLCVSGEMTWAFRDVKGTDRLLEYETKLNKAFPGSHAHAVCQYDLQRFDAKTLLDVLAAHPKAVIGNRVVDNFYFVPPEDAASPERDAAVLRHWIHNLLEHDHLQEERRKVLRQEAELELARANAEFQREFINMAGHELRTPLTTLILRIHGMQQANHGGRDLAPMMRSAERLHRLVEDILELATLQSGKQQLHLMPMPLPRLLVEAAGAAEAAAGERGIRIDVQVPDVEVDADPDRLGLALGRLLEHAVGTANDGSSVRVRGRRDGAATAIDVEVSTMAPADEGAGAGLGLHIAKGLVNRHGGTLDVAREGDLARYRIVLPGGA